MQSKKRFTETNLWDTVWFSKLTPKQKLLWHFINDKCDNIGIWEPNYALACFYLKIEDEENFINEFLKAVNMNEERILILDSGYWFLSNFVKFQYVKDKPLNPKNPAHKSYLRQINESGLYTWFEENQPEIFNHSRSTPLGDLSESSKDMDKDIDRDKEKEKALEEEADMEYDVGSNGSYLTAVTPDDELSDLNDTAEDETVNFIGPLLKISDSVDRILEIWPHKSETAEFDVFLDCEKLLTSRLEDGTSLYDAEKSIKDDFKIMRKKCPGITLCQLLLDLTEMDEENYKEAS